jgi:hypothetical protein
MQLPKNVRWFERLSYSSLAATAALLPFNEKASPFIHRMGAGAFVIWLCFFAVFITIIRGISRRRLGWLRWVKLLLIFFGLLGARSVANNFLTEPVYGVTWLISMILDGMACYLIFTGDAVAWFKPRAIEELHAPVP